MKGRKRIYDGNNSVLLDMLGYWGKQYSAATLKQLHFSSDDEKWIESELWIHWQQDKSSLNLKKSVKILQIIPEPETKT